MFEDVPTEDLIAAIAVVEHDFEDDLGASRIDAIIPLPASRAGGAPSLRSGDPVRPG